MEATNYRRRITLALVRVFFIPPLSAFAVAYYYGINTLFVAVLMVLSVPLSIVGRSNYSTFVNRRRAKQLGAREIPCIVGRLPGNLDIMFGMVKSFQQGYVLQGLAELFEKQNSTIINTRVLWDDQACSSFTSL